MGMLVGCFVFRHLKPLEFLIVARVRIPIVASSVERLSPKNIDSFTSGSFLYPALLYAFLGKKTCVVT